MTYKNQLINGLKQGFLFYAFSTILIAIQFSFYIVGSPILDYMDFEGWVFFAASCVSHASQFALLPYLLGFLVLLCRFPKTARVVQIVGVVLLCVLNYLNSQVYAIYHFHINGFVLSMVFGGEQVRYSTSMPCFTSRRQDFLPSLPPLWWAYGICHIACGC